MSDLPTIEYVTESETHRRIRYERNASDPTDVRRVVERHYDGQWHHVGSEQLTELVIDGEHRMPRCIGQSREVG